jgi:hypothetical protein
MAVDPGIADLLRELQNQSSQLESIRKGIELQNSVKAFAWLHLSDLVIITIADIIAAGAVLITFESWRETDRQHTERAQKILSKLSPHMQPLLLFLGSKIAVNNQVSYAAPWSHSSQMWADFSDPSLLSGALDWRYPGGEQLNLAFQKLKQLMNNGLFTVDGGMQ